MSKLTRVTAKVFGATADGTLADPEIGQFGSAKAGTYVGTGDVATIQNLSAWSNGWIDAVTPTQQFPSLPERTGVDKVLSYQNAYVLQQGIPEWDSGTDYYTNGFCTKAGKIYISQTDNNLNNDPASDTVNWKEFEVDLSGKADIDLANVNDSGTSRGAGWSMPSTTYTDLTFGASGTTYTAPANGWMRLGLHITGNSAFIQLVSNEVVGQVVSNTGSTYANTSIPVAKGSIVSVYYGGADRFTDAMLRFIYAKGSESEVS